MLGHGIASVLVGNYGLVLGEPVDRVGTAVGLKYSVPDIDCHQPEELEPRPRHAQDFHNTGTEKWL